LAALAANPVASFIAKPGTTTMKTCDAFVLPFDKPLGGASGGPLSGLTIGVKDNFDVAGTISGAGSPEYAADQSIAVTHARVVETLLANGASISGKTQMDELAYSLMGLNARYGVPLNPAAPDRVPGGSSSGSASATAAGLVDIGLGTDTGGSVRLPASFCGLYGWRATHGLIPADGMVPLAASYDVAGFFTRDLALMSRLVSVFAAPAPSDPAVSFWMPEDLWSLAMPETADRLRATLPDLEYRREPILPEGGAEACLRAFRMHQGYEIWQVFGAWITARQPDFGPGIKERFEMASRITQEEFEAARTYRDGLRATLDTLLPKGTILVYPTAPGPAPRLDMPQSELEPYRNRALSLTALAGHAGLPQLSIPVATLDGAPIGLSLVGRPGSDALLAEAASHFVSQSQDS
jgi:amidase